MYADQSWWSGNIVMYCGNSRELCMVSSDGEI